MDDQFASVVLQPGDRRFRVNKNQQLAVIRRTTSPAREEKKEKVGLGKVGRADSLNGFSMFQKEFNVPGNVPDFTALAPETLPSCSNGSRKGFRMPTAFVRYRGKEVQTNKYSTDGY